MCGLEGVEDAGGDPIVPEHDITFDERDVAELKDHIMRRVIEPILVQAEAARPAGCGKASGPH